MPTFAACGNMSPHVATDFCGLKHVRPHNQHCMHSPASNMVAFVSAVASLAVVALMALVAGAALPNYNHLSQFISELGAREAAFEWPVRLLGFLPAGVLLLVFCYFAYSALPRSRASSLAWVGFAIYAAGYVVSAAFPCDLGCRPKNPSTSQVIHNIGGLAGYLLAPAFLFTLGQAARTWPGAQRLVLSGYGASGLALVGLVMLDPSSPFAGLGQRLLEGAVLVWAVLCGHYISRRHHSAA